MLKGIGRVAAAGCLLVLAGCAPGSSEPEAAAPAVVEGLQSINGTELFVKRMGRGEPIVVVHGGPVLEHSYLLPHLQPLADTYELIFYDQRLSGRSAGQVDPQTVRIATFVEDIEGLRQELGLGRIHLIAHSWGGLLAQHYAIAHGESLRSLTLLDSMAASAELWRAEEGALAGRVSPEDRAAREALMATEAFANREPAALRELLLLSFRSQFADPTKSVGLDLYVPDDYMARSGQFGALGPELESFDLHEQLARVEVPTLILYGSEEPGGSLGGAGLHEAVAGSEYVVVNDAGHFPFIEQPEAFLAAVRGFLQGLAPAR